MNTQGRRMPGRWAVGIAMFVVIAAAGLVRAAESGGAAPGPAAGQRPNIVILLADDLGLHDVGYMGGDVRTPHIDRLAADGLTFADFYAMAFCTPTRAGLLTGRWPIRFSLMHRVVWPWTGDGLPADERTLPEALGDAGYGTRALVGKWHLGHGDAVYHPLNHGFTSFLGTYNGAIDYYTRRLAGERDWHRDYEPAPGEDYVTDEIGREAEAVIRAAAGGEPFFLLTSFTAPHQPNQAPQELIESYAAMDDETRQVHAAMVTAMDTAIGGILTALEETGALDNTLLVFLSDNGGSLTFGADNGPYRGQKGLVFEGGIRVPALVHWPAGGLSGGETIEGRVGYIDLMPTLLTLAGIEAGPSAFDGVDLTPMIREGAGAPDRPWFSFRAVPSGELLSVIDGRWKFVRMGAPILATPESSPEGSTEASTVQEFLFDLETDPYEQTNLKDRHPDILARLDAMARDFRALEARGPSVDFYDGAAPITREWHGRFSRGEAPEALNGPVPGFTPADDWRVDPPAEESVKP